MTDSLLPVPALNAPQTPGAHSPQLAINHCMAAWNRTYQASRKQRKHPVMASIDAGKSYREAMPLLFGYDNICDFIACTAHGILIEAISVQESSKLLYAAQVALGSIHKKPAPEEPKAALPTPLYA